MTCYFASFLCSYSGYLLVKIGRKWTMIMMAAPLFIGYMFFVIAYEVKNEGLIYAGRILTGKDVINMLFFQTSIIYTPN